VRTFAKIVDENAHPWKAASPRISPPREIGATLAAPYVEASRDETSLAGARESPLLAANSVARLGLCDRPSSLSDTLQNSSTHYAIGDIHGRRDLLDLLLSAIEDDARERGASATIVFTGDYVDRGPDSFGVVERLIAGPKRKNDRFVCLRGNHDDMFSQLILNGTVAADWRLRLFSHTIASYGASDEQLKENTTLQRHANFIADLPLYYDYENYLFVHAGVRPGVTLADQSQFDLLWIRDDFLNCDEPLPWRVVHGHTIVGPRPAVKHNRISIDTGAYQSGILTAAVLDGDSIGFLSTNGPADHFARVREKLLAAEVAGRAFPPPVMRGYSEYLAHKLTDGELLDLEKHFEI
jgi:serine/threonine protein phosphatase 1